MATTTAAAETVAELLESLGGISPERVRLIPAPGTATESDVLRHRESDRRLFELVDGTLVEKAIGYMEGVVAGLLLADLILYLRAHPLGIASGADGIVRLVSGLVRIPDVSFVSWDRLPDRQVPREPIPQLTLDLAVEVLSEGNTPAEMDRKVAEYLGAGTKLVWLIDPRKRSAWVHAPGAEPIRLDDGDSLDGGDVLPGFVRPLSALLDEARNGPGV